MDELTAEAVSPFIDAVEDPSPETATTDRAGVAFRVRRGSRVRAGDVRRLVPETILDHRRRSRQWPFPPRHAALSSRAPPPCPRSARRRPPRGNSPAWRRSRRSGDVKASFAGGERLPDRFLEPRAAAGSPTRAALSARLKLSASEPPSARADARRPFDDGGEDVRGRLEVLRPGARELAARGPPRRRRRRPRIASWSTPPPIRLRGAHEHGPARARAARARSGRRRGPRGARARAQPGLRGGRRGHARRRAGGRDRAARAGEARTRRARAPGRGGGGRAPRRHAQPSRCADVEESEATFGRRGRLRGGRAARGSGAFQRRSPRR